MPITIRMRVGRSVGCDYGRTWYSLDIWPHAYWTVWTDWLLHRIHHRVLRHIKRLAEK